MLKYETVIIKFEFASFHTLHENRHGIPHGNGIHNISNKGGKERYNYGNSFTTTLWKHYNKC